MGNSILTDNLIISFIELPKLHQITGFNFLQKFMWFIKTEGTEDAMLKTLISDENMIRQAHEKYKNFTGDDQLRYAAEAREKFQLDQLNRDLYNERRLKIGLEEARTEGLRLGQEKGMEIGMEIGLEQGREGGMLEEKHEIIKAIRAKGYSDQQIHELTNIPMEVILNFE